LIDPHAGIEALLALAHHCAVPQADSVCASKFFDFLLTRARTVTAQPSR